MKAVLNLVATADWVVAWFPKGIQQLGFWSSELGSLGHDGFRDKGDGMYEIKYIRGGHSAAITEDMWDMVADFVLRGAESNAQAPAHKVLGPWAPKSGWARVVRGLGLFPPLVWGIIATLLYGGWLVIELALSATLPCHWLDYGRGAATALYALLIWLGVTRI